MRSISIAVGSFARGLLVAGVLNLALTGHALAWPDKPIRLLVGNAPGSAPDLFARVYAENLSRSLGVPVLIDNRAGATGNIAQDAVAKAPADGYTLLYTIANSFTTNPFLYAKLPYNAEKDFAPVAPVIAQGLFLVTGNEFPAKTLPDIARLARAQPDKVAYASYGNGGYPHLIMEMFTETEKLQMTHVPYRAGAITDVIGNTVPMVVEPAATAIPFVKAGKIRAVAFTGPKRHPALPDVPTFGESHPGIELTAYHGVWAPAGTPRDVIARLNRELAKASRDPEVMRRVRDLFCEPIEATPEEFGAMVSRDAQTWSRIIKARNIKLD